jgi:hypothetical protein
MRALLRYAKDRQVEADLRSHIADAESRLEFLEQREPKVHSSEPEHHMKADPIARVAAYFASCQDFPCRSGPEVWYIAGCSSIVSRWSLAIEHGSNSRRATRTAAITRRTS